MKPSLLPALLLGLAGLLPARAQQPSPLAPAARPVPLTHDDSLAVLHRIFQRERRHGRIGTIADAIVVPSSVISLASRQNTDFQRGLNAANVAIFTPFLVSSIVQWARYSRRREQEAVLRFEQRQRQPLYVQRSYALALIEQGKWR